MPFGKSKLALTTYRSLETDLNKSYNFFIGVRTEEAWVCGPGDNPFPNQYASGPPCMTEEKTIYVWAKNASKLELPEDVGFHLPAGSHIVMNLHYKDLGNIPTEVTPGINVVITKKRPSKIAGVFQLINDYNGISPNRTGNQQVNYNFNT